MSDRRAIIVGCAGQDGRLLTRLLRGRGYAILGIGRNSLECFGPLPPVAVCSLEAPESIHKTLRDVQPHEVFYLAAHHASSEVRQQTGELYRHYEQGLRVNVRGVLDFLEGIRLHSPRTRLFYASSSLIFGDGAGQSLLDEDSLVHPREPYASCKLLASDACRDYRTRHGVFASVGILFNHESVFRPRTFLSTKIVRAAVAARRGNPLSLVVGDLDTVTDWGFAPDFVDAFTRILALAEPNDFVVATGIGHRVRDFLSAAFEACHLDWAPFVRVDPAILGRPAAARVGNSAKLRRLTGWQPTVSFREMVAKLVADFDQVSSEGLEG